MTRKNAQKGFTIIELVVVILLLGILTATALPRFMDVTDDAHEAVVDGVISGLGTSAALFRAQWYANGQPNSVTGGDYRFANDGDGLTHYLGFPSGRTGATPATNTANSMTTSDMCVELFEGLLQDAGRPSIRAKTAAATEFTTIYQAVDPIENTDFVAYLQDADEERNTCYYAYTGQFTSHSFGDVPVIVYDATTGNVSRADDDL